MILGNLGRRVLSSAIQRVADLAARNELFEKPGERPRQPPLYQAGRPGPASPAQVPEAGVSEAPHSSPATRHPCPATLATIDAIKAALSDPGPVRVVNHWATWCIPCVEEFPQLKALFARFGDRARFLGVCWESLDPRGDEEDIREHVENFGQGHGLGWPSLVLRAEVEPESFFQALDLSFQQVPQTWIIGPDGRVLHRIDGVIRPQDLEAVAGRIEEILAGQAEAA